MQIKEIEIISENINNSDDIAVLKIIYFLFYGEQKNLVEDRGKLKQDLLEFPGWEKKPKNVKPSYLEDLKPDTFDKIFKILDLDLINEEDNFRNILKLFQFFYDLNKIKEKNESVSSISTLKSTGTNAEIKSAEKLKKLEIQKLKLEKNYLIDKKDASNNDKDATKFIDQIKEIEKQINKKQFELLKLKTGFYKNGELDIKCSSESSSKKVADWINKNPQNHVEDKVKDKVEENVEAEGAKFKEYDELDAISTSTRYTVTSTQMKAMQMDQEKLKKLAAETAKLTKDNQELKENLAKTQVEGVKLKEEFNKLKISSANTRSVARYEAPSSSYSDYDDCRYQVSVSPSYYVTPSYSSSSRSNSSSGQCVSSLTGIGKTNTGRLNSAGFSTVDDLRSLRRSVGGSQARFEQAMGSMGVSKRYARTAFKDL